MDHGPGPDFVCIGAQKAGTTWLYDNLAVQAGVWMPPEKELHYFNRVCPHEELIGVEARGRPPFIERYKPLLGNPSVATLRWLRRYHYEAYSTAWYYSLFPSELVGGCLAGDITPAYSTLDSRGVRYAQEILKPSCRVLLLIRNPVDRFWSGIKMLYRWKEGSVPVDAPDTLLRELESPSHRLRGDYPRMIRLWREFFGDRFSVFRYDRLVEDPAAFLSEVGDFLGIEVSSSHSQLTKRSNFDPRQRRMPEEVREILNGRYREDIEELEALVPGISRGWLEPGPTPGRLQAP